MSKQIDELIENLRSDPYGHEAELELTTSISSDYEGELDFEISDALDKLERMQLVTLDGDNYQALPLTQAKKHLDQRWDSLFDYNQ